MSNSPYSFLASHPLMYVKPETWKNIPHCVITAVKQLVNGIFDAEVKIKAKAEELAILENRVAE